MKYAHTRSVHASIDIKTKVDIEVDISQGLFCFNIVGLAGKAVTEARDRIYSAIRHGGFPSPKAKNHKILVSLGPANIKKVGTHYDAAIAISYLAAAGEIDIKNEKIDNLCILGELTLDGRSRRIQYIIPLVTTAKRLGFEFLCIPLENLSDVQHLDLPVFTYTDIKDLARKCEEGEFSSLVESNKHLIDTDGQNKPVHIDNTTVFADIRGQITAKKGVLISLCGGHHTVLWGPPGKGKTILIEAASKLQPPLDQDTSIECAEVYAYAEEKYTWSEAPFRAPHHSISRSNLLGKHNPVRPGEIALSHGGIIALNEFMEMRTESREALREPMEHREVFIQSNHGAISIPAHFTIFASCNPCFCGNYGSTKRCSCGPGQINQYRRRVSSAMWDRFDTYIYVGDENNTLSESLDPQNINRTTRARIKKIREFSLERNKGEYGADKLNGLLSYEILENKISKQYPNVWKYIEKYTSEKGLSLRAAHKILKVSRTIADIEGASSLEERHAKEAVIYRSLFENSIRY